MYRLLLILGLMFTFFIFTNTTDVQAGSAPCGSPSCDNLEDCENPINCTTLGDGMGGDCFWTGSECITPGSGACCDFTGDNAICENVEQGSQCMVVDNLQIIFVEGKTCSDNPCEESPDSTGECCSSHESTGCNVSECEAAVCDFDPYCCFIEWDGQCVFETESLCGNLCTGGPSGPIAVVPTMGQWGIIFASILLGAFGVIAILREEKLGNYFRK